MWLHRAIVTVPAGQRFPLDMLRYDACYPATSDDVGRLGGTLGRPWRGDEVKTEPTQVEVVSLRPDKGRAGHGGWTVARWHSFGVSIDPKPPERR